MSSRTLVALMWKHLMVRKRRFIHTPVEILAPLVCLFLIFISRVIFVHDYNTENDPSFIDQSRISMPVAEKPERYYRYNILYYPQNNFTEHLMQHAFELDTYGNKPDTPNIRGLRTVTEFWNKTDWFCPLIVFENLNGDEWPTRLIYSLRFRNNQGYANYFADFQWSIDSSFITIKTGAQIPQDVTFQKFPYYDQHFRSETKMFTIITPYISMLSLLIVFVFQMTRLLEEKANGIQELIKMVGVSSNMLGISNFLNVLPVGIVYSLMSTVFLKTTSTALLPQSNGFLMFLMFLLHFISVLSMAFACSYIVRNTVYVISVSMFVYIVLLIPAIIFNNVNLPKGVVVLSGIFPHVPMNWYWMEISDFEYYGKDLGWSEAVKSHHQGSGSILLAMTSLVLQSLLFFFLAWYFSRVAPGKYGIAQPWNFLFQRQYWSKNEVDPATLADEEELFSRDEKYFESPPTHLAVGIKIDNVSKMFPKQKALSNINLDVYKGEITVLLGHNGAGKTTLMSIITGMLSPSEGNVYVNGENITRNRDSVSTKIGLCPQHNLFFPDLTVLEHVIFFTWLKCGNYQTVRTSSFSLLTRLGLGDKMDNRAAELSGGMKRRLQLAIALAGDADILVLDEPTAGLDVETRRELWDLLLSLRGSRAVLLSTHFMEEADALGDRVAALHSGRLRCHATTMHLKKAIGTGYRLHLTTLSSPLDAAITAVVMSQVPAAALMQKSINMLTYNLPSATSSKFPDLFAAIEQQKTKLEIESIGVGVSNLEEVFLKLCSDMDISKIDDPVNSDIQEPTFNKVTGLKLYMRQFYVLLKRQFNFLMSKKISFSILQVIIPFIGIMVFTMISNETSQSSSSSDKLELNLNMYEQLPEVKVMYNIENKEIVTKLKNDYPNIEFVETKNITRDLLSKCIQDVMEYNKYVVGLELSDTHAKVLYSGAVEHAKYVGLNLLTNILSAKLGELQITTYDYPIHNEKAQLDTRTRYVVEPKGEFWSCFWPVVIVFIILATLSGLAPLSCQERVSGSRHIHLLCGCPSLVHWAATLFTHVVLAFVTLVVVTAIAAATLEFDRTIDDSSFIGCMIFVLTLGTFAYLAFMYFVGFVLNERGTVVLLVTCLFIFSLMTPLIHAALLNNTDDGFSVKKGILVLCNWIFPPHTLALALLRAVSVARLNAICSLNRQNCPFSDIQYQNSIVKACCAGEAENCFFCWEGYSPAPQMLTLTLQFFFYMTMVILMQEGVIGRVWARVVNSYYEPPPTIREDDAHVKAETDFVNNVDRRQLKNSNTAMLVQNLHKNYIGFLKSFKAVKGINFSVREGECFGLLGVNGAGKSTTFKMLTAEQSPTRGTIYANGYHLDKDRTQYMRSLGYCPQFSGLDSFQTGHDNLELLLTLRGLDANDVRSEVKTWLDVVGLEKFGGRAVSCYSGGMCRRLGAAAALCSGHTALLDEPTAGVDVAARRRVWAAVRVRLQQRPVLLSSHSMDEMEALCHRVAILAGGRVRAIGSPHELRARHARGHALTLKLRSDPHTPADGQNSAKNNVSNLKSMLHHRFNCTPKDEHKTMLHYHINETMQYSKLFAELEHLKVAFPCLLEDYSVTETTLEEVFLHFAKEQQNV